MSTIAFIGLGRMGAPMAASLMKAGERIVGFDVVAAARHAAAQGGVPVAASARASVVDADVVITMLPASGQVTEVWREMLPLANKGALFIDCSTIDVASTCAVHALAGERGVASLDAPVSGDIGGAKAATLTFMVGGAPEAFARGKSVLERMGQRIIHCGEPGSGQAAITCTNLILGASMIAVSEAFVLGEKLGLSHQALFDAASASSAQCWVLTRHCPVPGPAPASPANDGYKPGFTAALMLKDLELALGAARAAGAKTPLGAYAAQIYDAFAQQGQGASDFSAIIKLVRARSRLD